jgi:hypothetical protein
MRLRDRTDRTYEMEKCADSEISIAASESSFPDPILAGPNPPETGPAPDLAEAWQLIQLVQAEPDLEKRMGRISEKLLGRPYRDAPLDSRGALEALRINLEAFDCVTFIEAVLALSLSSNTSRFLDMLRGIRYQDGIVGWASRNHYMTDWVRNNIAGGFMTDLTLGPGTVERTVILDVVDGLQPKPSTFRYFPRERVELFGGWLRTGDLAFFASTKPGLDVFHTGIVVVRDNAVGLRHASRSAGSVIDQDLSVFIAENQMLGFFVARPCQLRPSRTPDQPLVTSRRVQGS